MTATLEITINRKRFSPADGVKKMMTPAELADLIDIPAQMAIVEREISRGEYSAVPADMLIEIEDRMHFLITRHFVMGG